jgi:sugar O-acyltransferase (sialic acid O-acetyltransferase NeuD family)
MALRRIVVVGAGGQAREVEWIIRAMNEQRPQFVFAGYVLGDPAHPGPHDSRDRVLGDDAWLVAHRREVDALALGIGMPALRLRAAAALEREFGPEYWPVLSHPSAIFDAQSCRFGHGALLSAGVTGTVNLTFEPFAFANFGCTLGHESSLGRCAAVMPGANLSGGVVLEEGALVGTGAQVLQYLRVGQGATLGAGAVLTKDVPPGEIWAGVPARPLKKG